jgi:antitoxin (DNA-binding transcriptional repressor) of toxin-antitoxin stability system
VSQPSITYRDLRNTPGRVFERLAAGETLTLIADGTEKALLIPIEDGDTATALDAWRRGRALLALARLQADARRSGAAQLSLAEVNAEVRAVRRTRRARESAK